MDIYIYIYKDLTYTFIVLTYKFSRFCKEFNSLAQKMLEKTG